MAFGNSIIARLGLDSRDFTVGLAAARRALGSLGAGFGAFFSIAGITTAVNKLVEYGDRIQDLSDRYNVNAEALQRLGNVAELEGSSLEGVAMGFDKLTKNTSVALGGNDAMIRSFAALGITVGDLRSLSPEEIMLKIGKGSMEAEPFLKVLGKSALELRPALAGIADGTHEIGSAIKAIDIKKLAEADDLFNKLWQTIRIGGAGALSLYLHLFQDVGRNVKSILDSTADSALHAFATMGHAAAFNFKAAAAELEKLRAVKWELSASSFWAGIEGGDTTASGKRKRRFGSDEPGGALTAAEERAAMKERDRNKLSLDDLAEHSKGIGEGGTVQTDYARRQALEIKRLEAEAQQQRYGQDFEGAQRTMDRANQMRQGLGAYGLKESEMTTATRNALDSSTRLASMEQKLDKIDLENE